MNTNINSSQVHIPTNSLGIDKHLQLHKKIEHCGIIF